MWFVLFMSNKVILSRYFVTSQEACDYYDKLDDDFKKECIVCETIYG